MSRVRPFGESAFLVEVDGPEAAQGLRRTLVAQPLEGVTGLVPGRASLLVEFDPLAADAGLRFVPEAFADRRYLADGSLQPRSEPGSVLADATVAAAQAVSIATGGGVTAADGSPVALRAESLCCHGDTPGAVEIAAAVRSALEDAGVAIGPP